MIRSFWIRQRGEFSDGLEHRDMGTACRTDSAHRHPGADRRHFPVTKGPDEAYVQAETLTDSLDAVNVILKRLETIK